MPSLVSNWKSPVSYLKKRGYIPSNRIEDEKLKIEAQKLFGKSQLSNNLQTNVNMDQALAVQQKNPKNPKMDTNNKVVAVNEDPPVNVEQNSGEKSSGFISAVKNKILDILGAGSKSLTDPWYNNIDEYNIDKLNTDDLYNEEIDAGENDGVSNLEGSPILLEPEINSYDYIDYLDNLEKESSNIFTRSVSDSVANINDNLTSSAVILQTTPTVVDSLNNLVKNLSSTDMQYITSFVKCFKETRNQLPSSTTDKAVLSTMKPIELFTNTAATSTKEPALSILVT